MTTTHSVWISLFSRVIPTVLSITALLAVSQGHSPHYAAYAAAVPRCADTELAVSVAAAQGGLGHAGMVIHYRNVSATTCSLSGYPEIIGLNFTTGKSRAAGRIRNGYLGGWTGYVNKKVRSLPLVVLLAQHGVASSMVQWADCATAQQKGCTVLASLWVNTPNSDRPFAIKSWMLVHGYFDATPIVPGNTGSAD